jgi:hypothetical protein
MPDSISYTVQSIIGGPERRAELGTTSRALGGLPKDDPSRIMWLRNILGSGDGSYIKAIKRINDYDVCLIGVTGDDKYWLALNKLGKNPFDYDTVIKRDKAGDDLNWTSLVDIIKIACNWAKVYGTVVVGSPSPRKASAYARFFLKALLTDHSRFSKMDESLPKDILSRRLFSVYKCLITMYKRGITLKDTDGEILRLDMLLAAGNKGFEDSDFDDKGNLKIDSFISRYVATKYPGTFYVCKANKNDLTHALKIVRSELGV